MARITIKDIYAGMPDAKDEIDTNQLDLFLGNSVAAWRFKIYNSRRDSKKCE